MFLDKNTINQKSETNSPVSYSFTVYGVFEVKDSSKLKLGFAVYTPLAVPYNGMTAGRDALL